MLRVTSGSAKGRKLKVPPIKDFRAVQDKVKLAIFSILGDRIIGSVCLDLYAGSGSLGIEALSRGASHCDFVDKSRLAELTILENLQTLGFSEQAGTFRADAVKFVGNSEEKYDVIFVDPFYTETHFKFLFENLQEILKLGGVVIFSHGKGTDMADALANAPKLKLRDTRKYGIAHISTIELA